MLSLLNNTNFFSQYGLLIVLIIALVVLMLISFNRRKKEDTYRNDLEQKIVPGAMVKTYYGLYGKVLKVTETTDGKIVLIETGEDKKVSYQSVHIRAIYALDEKQNVTLDENGNPINQNEKSESEKKFEELEKQLKENEEKNKAEQPTENNNTAETKKENSTAKSGEKKVSKTKKSTKTSSTKAE